MIRRALPAAAAAVLFVTSPGLAHSLLLESSPAAEATLAASPAQLRLRFNNRIEKRLSRITLLDERGTPQALTIAVADGGAERLTAAVPPLAPGAYRVEWHVLSSDGHVVSGSFGFRLAR
ncbi:MAG: copper resistance CopC family protein [Candidatus Rokuibacteriota bacterium]